MCMHELCILGCMDPMLCLWLLCVICWSFNVFKTPICMIKCLEYVWRGWMHVWRVEVRMAGVLVHETEFWMNPGSAPESPS